MIWIHGKYGGLCNRLFTFANLVCFAEEHGVRVINPAWHEYRGIFSQWGGDPLCRYPPGSCSRPGAAALGMMRPVLHRIPGFARRLYPRSSIELGEQGVLDLTDTSDVRVMRMLNSFAICSGFNFLAGRLFEAHQEKVRSVFAPAAGVRSRLKHSMDMARG